MRGRLSAVLLATACLLWGLTGRSQEEPFEPDPVGYSERIDLPRPPSGFAPVSALALRAIRAYQTDIGPNSIARCPFAASCSRFAAQQIEQRGLLLGIAYFIDRFFYRENSDMHRHYGKVTTQGGAILLDDDVPAAR